MKSHLLTAATIAAITLLLPGRAAAAAGSGPKARLFAKYDANHNGVIDGAEKDALRRNFAAAPKGELARYDRNHDGKLDDEEIAAIRPPHGRGKSGHKQKRSD